MATQLSAQGAKGNEDLRKRMDDSSFIKVPDTSQFKSHDNSLNLSLSADINIPENEQGVKARVTKMTDEALFGADEFTKNMFLSDELNKQYHEHLKKKE